MFTSSHTIKKSVGQPFTVFFYGLFMTPLQGLNTILAAMKLLKDQDIQLVLIGGKDSTQVKVDEAVAVGAHIA